MNKFPNQIQVMLNVAHLKTQNIQNICHFNVSTITVIIVETRNVF